MKPAHTPSNCYNNPPKQTSLFQDKDFKVLGVAPYQSQCKSCKGNCINSIGINNIQLPPKIITVEQFTIVLNITLHAILSLLIILFIHLNI